MSLGISFQGKLPGNIKRNSEGIGSISMKIIFFQAWAIVITNRKGLLAWMCWKNIAKKNVPRSVNSQTVCRRKACLSSSIAFHMTISLPSHTLVWKFLRCVPTIYCWLTRNSHLTVTWFIIGVTTRAWWALAQQIPWRDKDNNVKLKSISESHYAKREILPFYTLKNIKSQ